MVDVIIAIFIFIGVIAVTTLLFSGWAVYGVIRAVASGIRALFSSASAGSRPALPGQPAVQARCPRARCHASNPPGARFCRRCGSNLMGNAVRMLTPPLPPRRQGLAAPPPTRAANRVAS